jgi:uncharacterized protein YggE
MKALTLSAIVFVSAISCFAQTDKDRPVVAVSGQAEVRVVPDEVVFRLEAENVNLDVTKAKAETDHDVRKIVAVAKNYSIEPQNIQTDYIRISERYGDYITGKPREFKGYAVTQVTTILLKNIARFESLLSDLVKAGVSDLSGVSFRASQMRTYMDQARALAMRAAKEKAIALAGEVGQKIGKAINITEVGMTISAAYQEDGDSPSNNYSISSSAEISRSVSDNQGIITPGMISIIARVKVTFELN